MAAKTEIKFQDGKQNSMTLSPKLLMRSIRLTAGIAVWLAFSLPIAAQIPGLGSSKTSTPAQQEQARDQLGRSTPRGTISAFTRAAYSGNYVSAARYVQVTARQRANTETLCRNLNELMDRYFHQGMLTISDSPDGTLDDGLPLDREKVGPLEIGGEKIYIELVRVKDPDTGQIWLISSETMAQVPTLYDSIEKTWVERVMPETLVKHNVLGVSLGQLFAWAASIGIPFLLLWLVSLIGLIIVRKIIRHPTGRRIADSWYPRLRWPIIFVLTLGIHLAFLSGLGFSLRSRIIYSRIVAILWIVAFAWLINRLLTLSFDYTRIKMRPRQWAGTISLMMLGERVVKVLIVLVATFLILTLIGVETSTVLAGVGIIGVALAIGAQKTVENFLGGVFLLIDKALAVGDLCKISNQIGYVEDITLRSVRLRTLDETLLSIPTGMLSQENIENFSARRKILAQTTLRLRYGTSAEQLRTILDEARNLLANNPKIEPETFRVRLVNFGIRGVEIELYAYVLTSVVPEFVAVREDLLLQIAGIVEASGSGFARPETLTVNPESTPTQKKKDTASSASEPDSSAYRRTQSR